MQLHKEGFSMSFFENLFDGSFMPHGHCLLWRTDLLFLHVGGDLLTVFAYASIPILLVYLVVKRNDLAFNGVFLMFAGFIFLCGVAHAISLLNIWHGYYYIEGIVKLATGLVSAGTAIMCWQLMPRAIAIPSNTDFREANEKLLQAQDELLRSNELLEQRVLQRTEELERLAQTDALTGMLNRGALMKQLTLEIERSKRYHSPLSLLMIDLDHFKAVNDTYGHPAGDSVLVELGVILKGLCRVSDQIGRYGGEEFLIVLPQTNIADGRELAERIRLEVMNHDFCQSLSLKLAVTCSIGVATLKENQSEAELLHLVDEVLYKAKKSGRNCVID
jgi:diguanylate cyclase (GGDEF)-like protein